MITATLLAILVVLMALRVPVSIAIGIAAVAALIMADLPLDIVPRMMTDSVDSYALLAVPFFVLAGNLMNATASPSAYSTSRAPSSAPSAADWPRSTWRPA